MGSITRMNPKPLSKYRDVSRCPGLPFQLLAQSDRPEPPLKIQRNCKPKPDTLDPNKSKLNNIIYISPRLEIEWKLLAM